MGDHDSVLVNRTTAAIDDTINLLLAPSALNTPVGLSLLLPLLLLLLVLVVLVEADIIEDEDKKGSDSCWSFEMCNLGRDSTKPNDEGSRRLTNVSNTNDGRI